MTGQAGNFQSAFFFHGQDELASLAVGVTSLAALHTLERPTLLCPKACLQDLEGCRDVPARFVAADGVNRDKVGGLALQRDCPVTFPIH